MRGLLSARRDAEHAVQLRTIEAHNNLTIHIGDRDPGLSGLPL